MIHLFDNSRSTLLFPVNWANSVVRWIQGVRSPSGTITVRNELNPGDGGSVELDVNIGVVAAKIAAEMSDIILTRDDVVEIVTGSVDGCSIISEDGRLMISEDWIREAVSRYAETPEDLTHDDITDWDSATAGFLDDSDYEALENAISSVVTIVDEISDTMPSVLLSRDIGTTVAAQNHTHSGYASSTHSHGDIYASASHDHDTSYAQLGHTHNIYALSTHSHSGYASSSHTHTKSSLTDFDDNVKALIPPCFQTSPVAYNDIPDTYVMFYIPSGNGTIGYANLSEKFAKKTDLSDYVKIDDISDYVDEINLDGYAKTTDLASYAKTSDLSAYAKTTDLADYAKTSDLDGYLDASDFAALEGAIDELSDIVSGLTLDVDDVLTVDDIGTTVAEKNHTHDEYLSDADMSEFAKTADIALTYATKAELDDCLTSADLSLYALKSDLTGFVTSSDLSGFLTSSDLSGYAKTSDLSSYAKTSDLNNYVTSNDLTNYVTYNELDGYLDSIDADIEDIRTTLNGIDDDIGDVLSAISSGITKSGLVLGGIVSWNGTSLTQNKHTVNITKGIITSVSTANITIDTPTVITWS